MIQMEDGLSEVKISCGLYDSQPMRTKKDLFIQY